MKKQDRIVRAEQRSCQLAAYDGQEAAIDTFVHECRITMVPAEFERFYSEATATAGNSFHLFEAMIDALSRTETKITPGLRKAIDSVLDHYQLDRIRITLLATLQYDDYWNRQYGYD